jgi:SAM-dependent methyltransferase
MCGKIAAITMTASAKGIAVFIVAATTALGGARADEAAMPAVECPLAKADVAPADLHPFADVAKYIAFLERPERAKWQRPDAVIAALRLAGDEVVADVGAGSGYFSFRFARALPRGRVVALDIDPEMVRHVHHRAMTEKVGNLLAVLGKADDPAIPEGADIVFVCDVLHHVPAPAAWLGKLAAEMKLGARLVLIEFKEGKLPQGPPEKLKISRAKLVSLATDAGLVLVTEQTKLLPYQTLLVFAKPRPPTQ